MKNHLLLTTILCGCSLTAWSAMPIEQPWQTITMAEEVTPEASTGEVVIKAADGIYTKNKGNWAAEWTSKQANPKLTFGCPVNNISILNSKDNVMQVFGGLSGSSEYSLGISEGFLITGYSFDFVMTANSKEATIKVGEKTLKSTTTTQHVEVKDLSARTVKAFLLSGGNNGIDITNLKVTYNYPKRV